MVDRQKETLKETLKRIKARNDAIGEGFCVAKWWHQEMHLAEGINMSCYHCPPHALDKGSDLHNTLHKKQRRYEMLNNIKPEECTRCWDIEDTGEFVSPRQILSLMYLRRDPTIIETTATHHWNDPVFPKYLEVSFSNECNLRCTYCAPQKSSSLYKEMETHGEFDLSHENRNHYSLDAGWTLHEEETNPYLKRFWNWIPNAIEHLDVLRVTGGEPFLEYRNRNVSSSMKLKKLVSFLNESTVKDDFEFQINSNLSFSTNILREFLFHLAPWTPARKNLRVYASIDSWGEQAEYIRHPLKVSKFEENIRFLLDNQIPVTIMTTYSVLSGMSDFPDLLYKIAEWREDYAEKEWFTQSSLMIDTPHMTNPRHLSAAILPKELKELLYYDLGLMEILNFSQYEMSKFKTALDWIYNTEYEDVDLLRHDFVKFVDQIDKRRNTDFLKTFPYYADLLKMWKSTNLPKDVDIIASID